MFNSELIIDVHGHQTTPPSLAAFAWSMMRLRNMGADTRFSLRDDDLAAAMESHVKALDARCIDIQMMSPRPVDMLHWEVPAIQEPWCRTINDVTAQICRLFPHRFVGLAQLPQDKLQDTSNCVAELERCIEDLGFVGAIVNPDPGADSDTPGMAEKYWYPLYERAQELGAVLMIHGSINRDRRIQMVKHAYQVNNFVSQFYATLALEHGDVFRDFPDLHIFVCHLGGALNRFSPADLTHQFGTVHLPNNLMFDGCAYDKDYLALGIKQKGSDRILFGSECPGSGTHTIVPDTGRPSDDLVPVIASFDTLDDTARADIFNRNALRFFPRLAASPVIAQTRSRATTHAGA
jgi:predicted TIM-barrel fold metal-dependent hydrolase